MTNNNVKLFCTNCGAQIVGRENDKFIVCDYCGANNENIKFVEQSDAKFNKYEFDDNNEIFEDDNNFNENSFTDSLGKGLSKASAFFGNLAAGFGAPRHDEKFYGEHNHHHHGHEENYGTPYYAVIEKSALFYKGECPGIAFTNSGLCDSYEECVKNIQKKLNQNAGKFSEKQPAVEELRSKNPGAKIIKLYAKF